MKGLLKESFDNFRMGECADAVIVQDIVTGLYIVYISLQQLFQKFVNPIQWFWRRSFETHENPTGENNVLSNTFSAIVDFRCQLYFGDSVIMYKIFLLFKVVLNKFGEGRGRMYVIFMTSVCVRMDYFIYDWNIT